MMKYGDRRPVAANDAFVAPNATAGIFTASAAWNRNFRMLNRLLEHHAACVGGVGWLDDGVFASVGADERRVGWAEDRNRWAVESDCDV